MAEYTEKIPQHRHCVSCRKAFVGEGKFCSPVCEDTSKSEVKGKLRKYLILEVILVAIVVVALWVGWK
jgi:predicted nucleic acid-binding Zn ribbon protein